jgi:hypothetical protein
MAAARKFEQKGASITEVNLISVASFDIWAPSDRDVVIAKPLLQVKTEP